MYLVLVEAFTYEFFWLANFSGLMGRPAMNPRSLITGETIRLAAVLAGAWVMSRLERRSLGDYGLPLRGGLAKHFCQGAAFGILEISAVLGTLAALGYYHFGAVELHGTQLIQWLAFWMAFFIVVGLFEEFAFRGYVQFALTQGLGFWLASLLTSLTFGAVHLTNPGETWTGIAGVVLTGLFWCFTLRRTGSLWFAVGMHAAFDFGETFLYSVPDSGTVFPGQRALPDDDERPLGLGESLAEIVSHAHDFAGRFHLRTKNCVHAGKFVPGEDWRFDEIVCSGDEVAAIGYLLGHELP